MQPRAILEQVQEASSQIQIRQQPEFKIESVMDDQFSAEIGSYSSIDEVLDRRIYDPMPLDYVEDTKFVKYLDVDEQYKPTVSLGTLQYAMQSKRARSKIGEIEMFMKDNYDSYHHNLNLDRVRNFEVYFPQNNIIKMQVEFEKTRLENIVQMRLGLKAKHISPLLIKSFKMLERKNSLNLVATPIIEQNSKPSSRRNSRRSSIRAEKKNESPIGTMANNNAVPKRRNSANPSDILLYSSSTIASSQFKKAPDDKRFPDLARGSFTKSFDLLARPNIRDKRLSMIREDQTDKHDKTGQSSLTIDSNSLVPLSRFRFLGGAEGNSATSNRRPSLMRKFKTSIDFYNPSGGEDLEAAGYQDQSVFKIVKVGTDSMEDSGISLPLEEFELETPWSGEEIHSGVNKPRMKYSVMMQKLSDKLAENSKVGGNGLKTDTLDKEYYNMIDKDETSSDKDRNENESSKQLDEMYQDRRLFDLVLQSRLSENSAAIKRRSTSEGKGRDVQDFIKKNNLKDVVRKMNDNSNEQQSLTSTN